MKCEACGKPIPEARLEVLPDTRFCVNCTDGNSPQVVNDPDILCAKASPSGQNGFSPKS